MPTAYGAEFRQDVIDVARKGEAPMAQIAKDFVSPVLAPSYSGVAGRQPLSVPVSGQLGVACLIHQ